MMAKTKTQGNDEDLDVVIGDVVDPEDKQKLEAKNVDEIAADPVLTFQVPDQDAPGYLERMIAVGGFMDMMETKRATRQGFLDLTRFLADYVSEPKNIEDRLILLQKASQAEIMDLLEALGDSGKPNPQKSES